MPLFIVPEEIGFSVQPQGSSVYAFPLELVQLPDSRSSTAQVDTRRYLRSYAAESENYVRVSVSVGIALRV